MDGKKVSLSVIPFPWLLYVKVCLTCKISVLSGMHCYAVLQAQPGSGMHTICNWALPWQRGLDEEV